MTRTTSTQTRKDIFSTMSVADLGSPFHQTQVLFREYTGYTRPLSYDEWAVSPDEFKAAILYLQFYDQITLAWMKTRAVYVDVNDGVSEILKYLNKNVEKIMNDRKRFTPNYIYRVAWNCLSCLCWNDPGYNYRCRIYQNEMSNIIGYDEDELDLFDTIVDDESERDSKFDFDGSRRRFAKANQLWDIIEEMGPKTKIVVANLLGETSYTPKELKSVSEAETIEIIAELRIRLADFAEIFC